MSEATTPSIAGTGLERLLAGDPQLKADPYPLYASLRDESPVYDGGHVVVLTSYEEVKRALLDVDRFSNEVQRPGTTRVEAARSAVASELHLAMFDRCIAVERLFLEETDGDAHTR